MRKARGRARRTLARRAPAPTWSHGVQFIAGDRFPSDRVAGFLSEGLHSGEAALAIARPSHLAEILAGCDRAGVDVAGAREAGTLLTLDSEQTLASLMREGRPDASLFAAVIGAPVMCLGAGRRGVRAYGDIAGVLWDGQAENALALEDLWHDLLERVPLRLLCGHEIESFGTGVEGFREVCSRHDLVWPGEGAGPAGSDDLPRLAAELQLRSRQLEVEVLRRREAERAEREAREQLIAAHERLIRLQTVTAALSEAVTPEDVGRVVGSRMPPVADADEVVLVVPEGASTLRVLATGASAVPRGDLRVDSNLPEADAYRTGLPVWITSPDDRRARYPNLPDTPAAMACLPVGVGGTRLGVLVFGFLSARTFSPADRALLQDLAHRVDAALERASLYATARRSEKQRQEANQRKEEFLALLGHELRNPLAPIMTAVHIMKLRGDTASERERAMIERQVKHVSRLVDDLLDVSRITQGKLELQKAPVSLGSVVTQALELASPLIEQRMHRLSVEMPEEAIWVEADAARLAQAVANLLTNAAKYTDIGGEVSVRVTREATEAVIAVRDTGVGIPEHMLDQIFEPFVQVDRTVEKARGGLGLGLALVKNLAELHGGTVEGASAGPGRGSEFRIRIPLRSADPPTVPVIPDSRRRRYDDPAARRRVLVVDDNRDAAEGLAEILRALGHEAHVAFDGAEAVEKARELELDAVILDLNLPVMDGHEAARRIREHPGREKTRFIAVTGFGTEDDRARSLAAGFAEHLVKPIDLDHLFQALEAAPVPAPPNPFALTPLLGSR